MNLSVLLLAAVIGAVIGALLWRTLRSLPTALAVPVVLVGIVAAVLPWELPPQNRRGTRAGAADETAPGSASPNESAPGAGRDGKRGGGTDPSLTLAMLQNVFPVEVPSDGYVGSQACRECHAENHATWMASYHRSMTQLARPDVVQGDFDDVHLRLSGQDYHLQRRGDLCVVNMPDPTAPAAAKRRLTAPVVMTTGSHHMQAYWFVTGAGRTTAILPLVHLTETGKWIPRAAAFIMSDGQDSFEVGRWNNECSRCHSTHRRERMTPGGAWDTHVGEFGISCEACHGPGQRHVTFRRRSPTLNAATDTGGVDPIVNPSSLGKVASAQVCGQCHSVVGLTEDETKLNVQGHSFRPGEELTRTHEVWQRDSAGHQKSLAGLTPEQQNDHLDQTYYRDGMIRVSGREYNGLLRSPCYQRGEMTCLSCHQMHQSESDARPIKEWADDQLRVDALSDDACLQCHEEDRFGETHTHHAADSAGSRCYNCHMPHTTYGLLKAIRSHTISSPDLGKDLAARRPNACNICHVDQTASWTAEHLRSWYGQTTPTLSEDQSQTAASVLAVLSGDAAERAMGAWSLGWQPAQVASGKGWQVPFLAELLNDPYPAVRLIAEKSLRTMPGLAELDVDVVMETSPDSRRQVIADVVRDWQTQWLARQDEGQAKGSDASSRQRTEVLLGPQGFDAERFRRLLQQRDNRPMDIAE